MEKQFKTVPDVKELKFHGTKDIEPEKVQQNPKVSIIIPVYKREEYLSECFYSALGQTLKDIEIIIVDKGEKDYARDLIEAFVKKDSRIIAPHIENNGYGASCNIGLEMAKGKYVFILESDDYILPETIEEMYAYAEMLGADVVKTPYTEFFADGRKQDCPHRKSLANKLPRNRCFSAKEYGELLEIHASVWSCLYRKTYLDKKNIRFVEAAGAGYVDVGFRIDSLTQTENIAWLDKSFYHYRVDSSGSSTNTWDVSVMNQRWREVHQKFSKVQDDYDKYYGPHLIFDEYINTVYRGHLSPLTKQEQSQIAYNLSFVSEEMIIKSSKLTPAQKQELVYFKRKKPVDLENMDSLNEKPDIKIFASYRIDQENEIIKNQLIVPVKCGAVYSKHSNRDMLGDDTGDNISSRRMTFNELTVQYWAWKNIKADYYGLCHYRRYISFSNDIHGYIDDHGELIEPRHLSNSIAAEYGLTDPDRMRKIISEYDAIAICSIDVQKIPTPTGRHETLYDFWVKGCINLLAPSVVDKVLELIKIRQPNYYQAAILYLNQKQHRGYNTFILNKELFFELCEFEFDILFALEKELDTEHYSETMNRTPGYIGEILSAIFLFKVEHSKHYKFCERQLVAFTDCQIKKRELLKPAFQENSITIIFVSSEFNVPYLGVCIESLLQHASSNNNYDIIVLSTDIGEGSQKKIRSALSKWENIQIRFFNPADLISNQNFHTNIDGYISLPFYKAFVPWLFPLHDKALILDSDLLINANIAELWHTDLGNKLIAGVKDVVFEGLLNGKEAGWMDYSKKVLHLNEPYHYINAGILIMDLEHIRRSMRLHDLMAIATRKDLKLADQDLINVAFDQKIAFLDPKWNYFVQANQWVIDCINLASKKDIDEYRKAAINPAIFHFANHPKPWGAPSIPNASEWWLVARASPYYEELLIRLMNFQIYSSRQMSLPDNRSGVRRFADKLIPPGTQRRAFAKWILPKGSLRWSFCKQIYYIFKPQYRPQKQQQKVS